MSPLRGGVLQRARVLLPFLAVGIVNAGAPAQPLELSQYAHTSWRRGTLVRQAINGLARPSDGYLWLLTDDTLFRFDGTRATAWHPPAGLVQSSQPFRTIRATSDGTLWIGMFKGLASVRDGKVVTYPDAAGKWVSAIAEDSSHDVWFGMTNYPGDGPAPAKLCVVRRSAVMCDGAGRFGRLVLRLFVDHAGSLWVLSENGLWRWMPGVPKHYSLDADYYAIAEHRGAIVLGSFHTGLRRLEGGVIKPYSPPGVTGSLIASRFLNAADGTLWIASPNNGVVRVREGGVDAFTTDDGLSRGDVNGFLEDREGNVWVATDGGLNRFHPPVVARVSTRQGLSTQAVWSVRAASDGSVWIGTQAGLNRWHNGRVTTGGRDARAQDPVYAFDVDDRGSLWASTLKGIARYDRGRLAGVFGGPREPAHSIAVDGHGAAWIVADFDTLLTRWTPARGIEQVKLGRFGSSYRIHSVLADRRDDGIWVSVAAAGVAFTVDGQIKIQYSKSNGLASNYVHEMRLGSDGALWAATRAGLSRIQAGRIATLNVKNGLPCDLVEWSMEDDEGALWIYSECALTRIGSSELAAWISDTTRHLKATSFGRTQVAECCRYGSRVTKATDGRIWFVDEDGLGIIDPRHVPINSTPPLVNIESITANGISYDVDNTDRRLPPHVRSLRIQYTALSLVAPEKVRFRIMLEGQDTTWREVVDTRQVEYSNLPPRKYRFRVMASNNDGVWNTTGASLTFTVAPAFAQTLGARVLLVTALLALVVALHRARVHQLERRAAERRRSEDALAKLRSDLASATRVSSLATLTASIAHEVNQPLAGIVMNADTCQRMLGGNPPNVDGAREAMRRLARDGKRATDVIARVRAVFARKALEPEPVDLNDATREVIALSQAELRRANAELRVDLADGLPQAMGDRVELQQVIINLVRNACEAMHDVNGRPRVVTVTTHRESSDRIGFQIRDTGVGLGPDGGAKLFDSFHTTKTNGMGIGLSVCRSIIEHHGGHLWATANDGPGATFAFTIPCDPAARDLRSAEGSECGAHLARE